MSEILEIVMIVSFGASWPLNVIKSYKARTTKGKSLAFLLLIFFGYVAGIGAKLVMFNPAKWYVLFFYVLNFVMVFADLMLYIRNCHLDKQAAEEAAAEQTEEAAA
jgi:hypothetical protein